MLALASNKSKPQPVSSSVWSWVQSLVSWCCNKFTNWSTKIQESVGNTETDVKSRLKISSNGLNLKPSLSRCISKCRTSDQCETTWRWASSPHPPTGKPASATSLCRPAAQSSAQTSFNRHLIQLWKDWKDYVFMKLM